MDYFLLVATILVSLILLAVNIYLLAVYIHPDDKGFGTSFIPKVIVVLGLTLSWGQVLLLPLDISNTRNQGGLDMTLFWTLATFVTAGLLFVIIPFGIYYYGTDENKSFTARAGTAIIYTIIGAIVAIGIYAGFYFYLRETDLPIVVQSVKATTLTLSSATLTSDNISSSGISTSTDKSIKVNANLTVFTMAFLSFVGWILLVLFGGAGLFAIPIDFINSFRFRPIKRSQKEILQIKGDLADRVSDLIQLGSRIEDQQRELENTEGWWAKRKLKRNLSKSMNKFTAETIDLDEDYELFTQELNIKNVNPAVAVTNLGIGIFFMAVAIIWWIHILFSVISINNGFTIPSILTITFIFFEETLGVSFLSCGLFSLFAIYLIFAVTKGNVKFGLKIPFIFAIHPMKPNETLMNSFLFNVWLLLCASVGVVQFLSTTFAQYTRLTSADFMFGVQVRYIAFFKYFYAHDVFEYAFLGWSIFTMVVMVVFGKNRGKRLVVRKPGALLADN